LRDFYDEFDEFAVLPHETEAFKKLVKGLTPEERQLLKTKGHFYIVDLRNVGGLVMPVPLEVEFVDGSKLTASIPAEIWRHNGERVSKLLHTKKEIRSITLDPRDEIADVNRRNNHFPRRMDEKTFRLQKSPKSKNPMQRANDAKKKGKEKPKPKDQ